MNVRFTFFSLLFALCSLSYAQDTTSNRMVGINWSEGIMYFQNDSSDLTTVIVDIDGTNGGPQIAIFQDLVNNRLIMVADSNDTGNDRRFYSVEPFTGSVILLHDPVMGSLAAADIAPTGEIYAVSGNSLGSERMIYRIDVDNHTDVLLGQFDPGTGSVVTLEFNPADSSLYIIQSYDDTIYVFNLATNTATSQFVDFDGQQIKGAYADAQKFYLSGRQTGVEYIFNLAGASSDILWQTSDFLVDIEMLDLIATEDTVWFCPWDSVYLASRFNSNSFQWYRNGSEMAGETNSSMYANQAGEYRLLVEIGNSGTSYMWSEPVVLVEQSLAICTIGLEEPESWVKIYPSPTSDVLFISTDNFLLNGYEILTVSGQVRIRSNQWNIYSPVDVSALPAGIYIIRMFDNIGNAIVKKFVKN